MKTIKIPSITLSFKEIQLPTLTEIQKCAIDINYNAELEMYEATIDETELKLSFYIEEEMEAFFDEIRAASMRGQVEIPDYLVKKIQENIYESSLNIYKSIIEGEMDNV